MQLDDHTHLEFVNNTASYGGAICALPTQVHGYTFTDKCFLNPSKYFQNITLNFNGNSASIGEDIFATSLVPCLGQCRYELKRKLNTSDIFFSNNCIGLFQFGEEPAKIPNGSISTCPKLINCSTSNINPIPGFPHYFNISQIDELGNDVTDMFLLTAKLDKASKAHGVSLGSQTLKNYITFYGEPGESGTLIIENSAQITRNLKINFILASCPPGFTLDNTSKSCICSKDLYSGITFCHNDTALMKPGYWAGYIGNDTEQMFTGGCVVSFCNFTESQSGQHYLPHMASTPEQLEKAVCGIKRNGTLCTKCKKGYTMCYHSPNLKCFHNTSIHANCTFGIPIYIVSELLPVTIIFLIILIFNISLTSGAVYSFVFYAQVLDSQFVDAFGTAAIKKFSYRKYFKYFQNNIWLFQFGHA